MYEQLGKEYEIIRRECKELEKIKREQYKKIGKNKEETWVIWNEGKISSDNDNNDNNKINDK